MLLEAHRYGLTQITAEKPFDSMGKWSKKQNKNHQLGM